MAVMRNNLQILYQRLDRYPDWFLASFTTVFVVIFVAVMLFDSVSAWMSHLLDTDDKKETLEFVALIVSGLMSFIGVLVLRQRARSAEKQAGAMRGAANHQAEANKLTEAGHAQDRLKPSIERLGNDETSVRIDAAYELYHLAKDNESYRETVCDILCGHIRQKTQEENYAVRQKNGPSEEVKTFLDLLCGEDRECPFSQCQIDLSYSFLRRVKLQEAQLRGANLLGAQLQEARLPGAQLQGASLLAAQLWEVIFLGAQLQGANLLEAQLQGANLSEAQLQGANLLEAQLQGADLSEAQLQGANLQGAHLQGADLSEAHLQGADLLAAHLQGARLSGAQLQGVNSSEPSQWSFQDRIRAGIGKESDFSNVVFSGGLNADQVKKIISSMPDSTGDKENKRMEYRLNEHVNQKASHGLPDNSGATEGAYTKDEAEKWMAEYEKSTSYQSTINKSKGAAV